MLDLLKQLCELDGTSGREAAVRDFIISKLNGAPYRVDAMGNLIVEVKGKQPAKNKVMLCAHMDEVGVIATFIKADGTVKFTTVGGINPAAVESGLKLGGKVVWLPTASACNHLKKMGKDPSAGVACVRDGKIVPELKDVFQLIKDFDVVLGTGHVSPEECFIVVEAARAAGVRKIVVTHPEWWIVDMSLEDQLKIVKDYDVYLERCFAQNMGGGKYKSNLPDNLEVIQTVGYKNVMISTDGGQVENPHWELAYEQYMQYMADHGVSEDELHYMTHTIQGGLLNLED